MDSQLIIKYYREGKTIREVANLCQCSASGVRKTLIRCGEKLRDKSEAQLMALESGKSKHPTEGKRRSEVTKLKIADGISKSWANLTDAEYNARVEKCRDNWNSLTKEEQEEMRSLAAEGLRLAAKEGSKMEKFLVEFLRRNGYEVIHHKKGIIPNEKLEIDIYLPGKEIIIEIDGPTHFLPIWGEDKLNKHVVADSVKSGLLIARGYKMIRVKHIHKSVSNKAMRDISNAILDKIKEIENIKLEEQNRYIELSL